MTHVAAAVAADIRRHGPLPFDRVLERALYDPVGGSTRPAAGPGDGTATS